LIDRRELAGFESAMRLKDLPVDQRREQLKPFRLESQRQLAALLTDAQIAKLDELRVNENEPNYEPLLAESQPAEAEPTEPQTNETGSAPDDGSAGEEAGAMESRLVTATLTTPTPTTARPTARPTLPTRVTKRVTKRVTTNAIRVRRARRQPPARVLRNRRPSP
jgi:hypothetical protein